MRDLFKWMPPAIALLAGIGLTCWGLVNLPFPAASVPEWGGVGMGIGIAIVVVFAISHIARWYKLNALVVGAGFACATALLSGAIWPFAVTIWFATACYALGILLLRLLQIDGEKVSGITVLLIGACLYGTVIGLLAHYPVNYPGLYALALALPVVFERRAIKQALKSLRDHITQQAETNSFLELAIALIALVHFAVALMPEVGHDALVMHLFIPGHMAARHEWGFDAGTYVWAVMPMMGDWLYSIGYLLAGEQAARLINVGFIFLLGWLIRDLVLWAGGNKFGALWAVLLFLTTPLTFTESSSLFIESIWGAFVVAGSLAILKLIHSDDDQPANFSVGGILLGGALAAKAVTLTILPVLFLVLVLRHRSWMRLQSARAIVVGLFLFISIGVIPYATAWYLTGNPVFPFFNQIFQSPLWPAVAIDPPPVFAKGLTWDVLYQVTFRSERFLEGSAGAAGFQWLLLFMPALFVVGAARHSRGFILFVVAVLSVALTFHSTAYLRYIFPAFAWVAAGIGVAISIVSTDTGLLKRLLLTVCGSVVVLNVAFFKSGTGYGDFALKPLMGNEAKIKYLNERLPIRNAVELVNNINLDRTPVALFSSASPLAAGLVSNGLSPDWYNNRFQALVSATRTSEQMAQLLMAEGAEFIILDSNWSMTDKRLLVETATRQLAQFGSITVRKLDDKYRFQTELMKNPEFSAFDGWSFSTAREQNVGRALVTVASPAVQPVSVTPGRKYKNSVTAKCGEQTGQGRLQINWLNSNGAFITTTINVFDCTPEETTQSMEVVAPLNASTAVVYATAHGDISLVITKVSFRL